MSNQNTYISFDVIDFSGNLTLSAYTLPITPLKFVPNFDRRGAHQVLWDFGDGTTSRSFSASKVYNFPGKYKVTFILYDCNKNAMISTESVYVTIIDYLPLSIDMFVGETLLLTEASDPVVTENDMNLAIPDDAFEFKCGQVGGPIYVYSKFPHYQPPLDVFYNIRGSSDINYWDIVDDRYSHLDKFHTLYTSTYNYAISASQFIPIDKISNDPVDVYVQILNGDIVRCRPTDDGACFAGTESNIPIYLKTDSPAYILVDFNFDKTNYVYPHKENFDYINNITTTLSANISFNTPDHIKITSNGMSGEGLPIAAFEIGSIKYYNTKIGFTLTIKDNSDYTIKHTDFIRLSDLNITITSGGDVVSGDKYELGVVDESIPGAFRGYVKFFNDTTPLSSANINISANITSDDSSTYTLSATTSNFTVYPSGYTDMYRKNEDMDATNILKDMRFQEILLDKDILFDDFIRGVWGGVSHESIGTKTYEKISNFVANTQDPNTCNVTHLDSLGDLMNHKNFGETTYNIPVAIQRVVDLVSIDINKLLGSPNKFAENFDIRNRATKDEFGRNIGDVIDPMTYIVDSNVPIVALEKFSNNYKLLNTTQPCSATGTTQFPLSTYTSDWGWPLVLPTPFQFVDIEKYYIFFDYVEAFDNTMIGGVVDFENGGTTISEDTTWGDMYTDGGVVDCMVLDAISQTLQIDQ